MSAAIHHHAARRQPRLARLAQGLRDAARYVETHPNLPIPADVEISYHIPAGTDKAGEDELHRIAAMLGANVTGDAIGEAHLDFGAVRYCATYISREHMAAYNAHMRPYHAEQAAKSLARLHAAVAEMLAASTPERAA